MLEYLKMCSASVSDQQVNVEHIVMDGGSSDGTVEWLQNNPSVIGVSEKDNGMYHALNKAIAMSRGDIVGHLNCDEQYLPGTLEFVLEYFQQNPDVDFLAGDFLIVDEEGQLLAFRKSFRPKWQYFFSNYLYTTTCALFYRRKIFATCSFDESYRSIADVIFLYQVMKAGFRGAHVPRYCSVFTYSGRNLSLDPISAVEKKRFNKGLPWWYKILKPLYFVLFFGEKILHGTYKQKGGLAFPVYTRESLSTRVWRENRHPTFRLNFKRHV